MKRFLCVFVVFLLSGFGQQTQVLAARSPALAPDSGLCAYLKQLPESDQEELESALESLKMAVKVVSDCPSEPTSIALLPPQPTDTDCRSDESLLWADLEVFNRFYEERIFFPQLENMLPATVEGLEVLNQVDQAFQAVQSASLAREQAFFELMSGNCDRYGYLDFPGKNRFGARGYEDSELLYQMEPVMSGLVKGQMLAPKLDLVRSHALTALARILQDKEGVMTLFYDPGSEKRFIDVESDNPYHSIFSDLASGYRYSEVQTGIQLGRLSWIDLNFVKHIFEKQLMKEQPGLLESARFVLPASPVLRSDLMNLIQKTFRVSVVLQGFDDREFSGTKGQMVTRVEAFPIFFRLQQLNHMLRDDFDAMGMQRQGRWYLLQDQKLTRDEAIKHFQKELLVNYGSVTGIQEALRERTEQQVQQYWQQWKNFEADPNPEIKSVMELVKSLDEPVELFEQLKKVWKLE